MKKNTYYKFFLINLSRIENINQFMEQQIEGYYELKEVNHGDASRFLTMVNTHKKYDSLDDKTYNLAMKPFGIIRNPTGKQEEIIESHFGSHSEAYKNYTLEELYQLVSKEYNLEIIPGICDLDTLYQKAIVMGFIKITDDHWVKSHSI